MTLEIKAIISAIILAYIVGISWYAAHEHNSYITYQASIKALGEAQAAQTKAKEQENDKRTEQVAIAYSGEYERLNAALDRLRHSSSGSVPKNPISSQSTNAPITQPIDARRDIGYCESSGSEPCLVTRTFFGNALMDAEDVDTWYEWATVQGVPVK